MQYAMATNHLSEEQQANIRAFLQWSVPNLWRSQSDAGDALLVSQEYFSQLKNGRKPIGPSAAMKIAKAAMVSFDDLLSGAAFGRITGTGQQQFAERPSGSRSITPTPTPMPVSRVRYGNAASGTPNRERALEMLAGLGYDRDAADIEMSIAALASDIPLEQDMPTAWWIDAVRRRMSSSAR